MSIERTKGTGQFAPGSCGGPGRKALADAQDRYKRETLAETAQALADDIPRLECELQGIDDELAEAEAAFVEQLKPTLRKRAKVGVTLARARVALHYVCDPVAFGVCGETPGDVALREYNEIRRSLEDAQRELEYTTEPTCTREEALADVDLWQKLHDYETIRGRVDELLGAEMRARQMAEPFGHEIPPLQTATVMYGDPFAMKRERRRTREMVNI